MPIAGIKNVGNILKLVTRLSASEAAEDELPRFDATPMNILARGLRPRRLLYIGKPSLVMNLMTAGTSLPGAYRIFSRPGLVTSAYADVAQREARANSTRIRYVGDLDPLAITTYVSLVCGGYDRQRAKVVDVSYHGITDEWIELCRQEARPGHRRQISVNGVRVPVQLCTRMTAFGRLHLRTLEEAGLDLKRMVGEESARLLRGGTSIDLHVASDPARYRPSFFEKLVQQLWA